MVPAERLQSCYFRVCRRRGGESMKARLLLRRKDESFLCGKALQRPERRYANGRYFGTAEEYSTYLERSTTVVAAGLDIKPKLFQHRTGAFDSERAVWVGPCEVVAGRMIKSVRLLANFSKHFRVGLEGRFGYAFELMGVSQDQRLATADRGGHAAEGLFGFKRAA